MTLRNTPRSAAGASRTLATARISRRATGVLAVLGMVLIVAVMIGAFLQLLAGKRRSGWETRVAPVRPAVEAKP